MEKNHYKALVVILVVALAIVAAGFAIALSTGSEPSPETVTQEVVPIPGVTPSVILDANQQQESLDRPAGVAEHQDAKDEMPPGVTPAELEEAQSTPPGIGEPKPLGGAQLLSCQDKPVQNFSERTAGTKVSMPVIHYTVSAPGTIDAIRNLFNTPSFGASSHDLLEPSGKCYHIVDYSKKAWTQGAFNSAADSVEIVCCTSDPSREWWLNQPIIKNGLLASWIVDRLRSRGLKPKLVNPVDCTPQAGWTDHERLECGNTHTDVGKNFPFTKVSNQVVALYNGSLVKSVWQATSGGKLLKQKPKYAELATWLKQHPGAVARAEKANDRVIVRRVTVPR